MNNTFDSALLQSNPSLWWVRALQEIFHPLLLSDGALPPRALRAIVRANPGPLLLLRSSAAPARILVAASLKNLAGTHRRAALLHGIFSVQPQLFHAVEQDHYGSHFVQAGALPLRSEDLRALTQARIEHHTSFEAEQHAWSVLTEPFADALKTMERFLDPQLLVVGARSRKLWFLCGNSLAEQCVNGPWSLLVLPSDESAS